VLSILSCELETKGDFCRLRVFGAALGDVRTVQEWRFTTSTLTAGLLNEFGAVVESLACAALLRSVGVQGELALALLEESGTL
jgi:hypothetical protein